MLFNPPRSATILAIVIAISGVSFGAIWLITDAMERRGEWAATEDLLSMKQAPRETSYPGVAAWLQKLLHQYCKVESGPDVRAECDQTLSKLDGLPEHMTALGTFLTSAGPKSMESPVQAPVFLRARPSGLLCASEFKVGTQRYAVTRPQRGRECSPNTDSFVGWAIHTLDSAGVPSSMKVPPFGDVVAERAYIIAQDGSLVSRRFSDQPTSDAQEGREFQEFLQAGKSGSSPSVVSVRSFFSMAQSPAVAYSGAYLDVTDLGFVSTPQMLMRGPDSEDVVMAVDVAFGTEWIKRLVKGNHNMFSMDEPEKLTWNAVAEEASKRGLADVNAIARRCGEAERHFEEVALCESPRSNRDGMVAAIRVGNGNPEQGKDTNRWLIAWMPALSSPLQLAEIIPVLALMLGGAGYLLLDRKHRYFIRAAESERQEILHKAEIERRDLLNNAETERREFSRTAEEARRELARQGEEQRRGLERTLEQARLEAHQLGDLFENLSVPVVTIDPNDDRIRYRNARARKLGLADGAVFRNYVQDEDQPIYDGANLAAGARERAYGVRLSIDGRLEQVIIRSTAIPAPTPAINARESDRLGLIALLSREDTGAWQARIEQEAADTERDRLGSFLDHGLAMLAEVACRGRSSLDKTIRPLLLTHLERRVSVIAELFSGWQKPLEERPRPPVLVKKAAVVEGLETLQRLAAFVARDRDLREQLRWGNGVLSRLPVECPPFTLDLGEWPEDLQITTRIEGAESFIFEELLINALKHGQPGVPPVISARPVKAHDRRWVELEIRNEVLSSQIATAPDAHHKYGGRRLVREACRRLGWELLDPEFRDRIYSITIRARAIDSGGLPA